MIHFETTSKGNRTLLIKRTFSTIETKGFRSYFEKHFVEYLRNVICRMKWLRARIN